MRRRLFLWLSAAAGYVGIGMVLGYAFGSKANNTPLWIGGVLILLGVLLLGMFISAMREPPVHIEPERATPMSPEDN